MSWARRSRSRRPASPGCAQKGQNGTRESEDSRLEVEYTDIACGITEPTRACWRRARSAWRWPGPRAWAARGNGAAQASAGGQLQPRHPAHPLQQLLRLPRSRRETARDQVPLRHARGRVCRGRRHRARERRREHAGQDASPTRSREADAAARFRACVDRQADRAAAPLDRRRREVGHALGLHAAGAPDLPAVEKADWVRNPIDRFILARLEREGLKPSPEADKATLLRRVTYDLTGLPPTPAEVDAFLADRSPDAYERRVDALLLSPRYGERMAVPWLDAARYADTHGYHIDSHRGMWPWRDWVIGAFNRNLPFDQFTIEQLAGDLLPERHARAEGGLGLQPQPHDQLRRRRDRRGVSGRVRDGSRRGDLDGVHGLDDGVRALPLAQVRPDQPQGVLPVLRVLQQRARARPRRPARERRADAPADRRPPSRSMLDELDAAIKAREAALDETIVDPFSASGRRRVAGKTRPEVPTSIARAHGALRAGRELLGYLRPLSARPHGDRRSRPSTSGRSAARRRSTATRRSASATSAASIARSRSASRSG